MQTISLVQQEEPKTIKLAVRDLISLKDAQLPGSELAMRPLDEVHVQRLVESSVERWPAVTVAPVKAGGTRIIYLLIDGYHRREAATRKQEPVLLAVVQRYHTVQDIVDAAFRANLTHGKLASEQTRGDYAYWLHSTYNEMSQEEIARRTGISQAAVSKAIAKREKLLRDAALEALGEGVKEQVEAERTCKQLTRQVLRFVKEVKAIKDEDLLRFLQASIKPRDAQQLARIGQLLIDASEK